MQFNYHTEKTTKPASLKLVKASVRNSGSLSARELEVLKLIFYCNDIIADELDLSVTTVRNHIRNIRQKTPPRYDTRAELLEYAIKLFGMGVVMRE